MVSSANLFVKVLLETKNDGVVVSALRVRTNDFGGDDLLHTESRFYTRSKIQRKTTKKKVFWGNSRLRVIFVPMLNF